MIETDLAQYLETNVVLVGSRVYPEKLPQEPVLPALTYFKVSRVGTNAHSGPSGLAEARLQISCWDTRYLAAKLLKEQVRLILNGFSGLMGATYVGSAFMTNEVDLGDNETGLYQIALDFMIWHRE